MSSDPLSAVSSPHPHSLPHDAFLSPATDINNTTTTATTSTAPLPFNTVYWAKAGKSPYWPALTVDPDGSEIARLIQGRRDRYVLVRFFGSADYVYVAQSRVVPFDEHYAEKAKKSRSIVFHRGLEEVKCFRETGQLPDSWPAEDEKLLKQKKAEQERLAKEQARQALNERTRPEFVDPFRKITPISDDPNYSTYFEFLPKRKAGWFKETKKRQRQLTVMRRLGLYPPQE